MQLSSEMQQLVVPTNDPYNQANTVSDGPFKKFPHFDTTLASINFQQANLLADFAGWHIHQNQEKFRAALGILSLPMQPSPHPTIASITPSQESSVQFLESPTGIIVVVVIVALVVFALIGGYILGWFSSAAKDSTPLPLLKCAAERSL